MNERLIILPLDLKIRNAKSQRSGYSDNLIDDRSLNWYQFKDLLYNPCLSFISVVSLYVT